MKTPIAAHMTSQRQPNDCSSTQQQQSNDANPDDDDSINNNDDTEHRLINKLVNETHEDVKLEVLLSLRNLVTACNKKKDSLVNNPNFNKIIELIDENHSSSDVKTQLALLLCSVAKGGEQNVKVLNDSSVDGKIFNLILNSNDDNLIEACLRCMRSIMSWPKVSRSWMLYENQTTRQQSPANGADQTEGGPARVIAYARRSKSLITQECVADIFAATCSRTRDQMVLHRSGALKCILLLLESPSHRVIVSALNWLIAMCLKNSTISMEAIKSISPSGLPLQDLLIRMMSKDECCELQFLSAKCFTQIYRALSPEYIQDDARIVGHVLPTLVRMVHRDKPAQLRAKAAECIAYLIECDPELQETASICDHLIESLANMLEYEQNIVFADLRSPPQIYTPNYRCSREREVIWNGISSQPEKSPPSSIFDFRNTHHYELTKVDSISEISTELGEEMRRSSFLALAALASRNDVIRKKIFNICAVMQHLVRSLSCDGDTRTLRAVLTCLLSLSRSVQQLRTSFADKSVYSALKNLLNTTSNEVLTLVLAILCNILLEFSPGKQHFLDATTVGFFCSLTRGSDRNLKLHGMWILMNMVYELKDLNLKIQILKTLGPEHVLNILETENDEELIKKTLGFLRNLMSQRPHIDSIMANYGEQILFSLTRVLDRPLSTSLTEQALCVLSNIADGTESKSLIMNNRHILSYLTQVIGDEQEKTIGIRLAAICCITNLVHREHEGSYERRDQMKKFGIEEKLKSMLDTNNLDLSDRARTAYNQFLIGIEEKYSNW